MSLNITLFQNLDKTHIVFSQDKLWALLSYLCPSLPFTFPSRWKKTSGYHPFPIGQHLYLSIVILDGRFLIVSDDETALALQCRRKFLQGRHLSLISTIAMTKIVANLNGKTLVRDKEIDLQTRVVVDILTYPYSKFY